MALADTAADANAALDAIPTFGRTPYFFPLTDGNYVLGRTYQLAGRRDEALMYLTRAANSSAAIEYPTQLVRSRLYQGIAFADKGDNIHACEAFASVVTRWGHAKPRSVSADEARDRMKALNCTDTK